jgi:hypothetical protein
MMGSSVSTEFPLPRIDLDSFADLACAAWKLRKQVLNQSRKEGPNEIDERLAALWGCLSGLGLEIQDHTGSAFDPQLGLDVLAFEPTSDLPADTVIETVRPTVYLNQKKIVTGLIVVGVPRAARASHGLTRRRLQMPPQGPSAR